MNDLVSIIIPTYKRSDKIGRALESAICQTYKNIEIIVVDDNAKYPKERVKTAAIVKQFPEIHLIQNKTSLGGALSRNEGIKHARGKFIAFLDDDDEYLPTKVEDELEFYYKCYSQDGRVGLVYCNEAGVHYFDNPVAQQMMGCMAGTSLWLLPKSVMEDVNYFDDVPCKQDSTVILKILLRGYSIYRLDKKLVIFYPHGNFDGISGTKSSNIIGLKKYRDFCRNNYDKLDNQRQIDDIESAFSSQFINLLMSNDRKKEARFELQNIRYKKMMLKNWTKVHFWKLWTIKNKLSAKKTIWSSTLKYFFLSFKSSNSKILTAEETFEKSKKEKKPIIRFGDGEFAYLNKQSIHYQNYNKKLADYLRKIKTDYEADPSGCKYILAVPKRFIGASGFSIMHRRLYISCWSFARYYFRHNFRQDCVYGDAFCFSKKFRKYADEFFRDIVKNRYSIFVHSDKSAYCDFKKKYSTNSNFVKIPSENAFDDFCNIMGVIEKLLLAHKEDLPVVFVSAGPCGKALVYELSKKGVYAIDVGHFWDSPL